MRFLTPKQIAAETQLAYRTVLKEIHEGRLSATRLAGQLRVSQRDYDAWLRAGQVAPEPEQRPEVPSLASTQADVGILRA